MFTKPPTVAGLAAMHRAGFSFRCRPCNRFRLWEAAELVAAVGIEETWESLRARTICPGCKMPIDGAFRFFEFYCCNDPAEWARLGLGDGGWGARQD
jgi:hypothetical protein